MKKIIFAFMLLLVITVFFSSYYIVSETEQAVITRMEKPVGKPIQQAGIYFKMPLIDTANFFEKRVLEWDGDVSTPIPTRDKKNIIVDATGRWKITDPQLFLESVGTVDKAQSRLDDIIDSNVRDVVSKHDLIEIVRNTNRVVDVLKSESKADNSFEDLDDVVKPIELGRDQITRDILKKSQPIIKSYGIELIDVRIKGLMYSQSVLETVYKRMISQYEIKAQNLRSQGDKERSRIEGDTEYQVKKIRSEAYRKAQLIRGEGDAESTKIYAESLSVDPDFYQFQRSLDAYETAINKNSTLIIGTDTEFFKVLKYAE